MTFTFERFAPPAELATVLRYSFYARGRIAYRSDKILPNGLVVAIFNRGEPHRVGKSARVENNPAFAHSWLTGVQTTPVFNTPGGETHVLGLLFEPIGFHALFGHDMRALADCTLDARDVLPEDLVGKIEMHLGEADNEGAHRQLHTLLAARSMKAPREWLERLYSEIVERRGDVQLAATYQQIGLSPRHISARFKTGVGVNPKVLCRIYRLQALLMALEPAAPVDWTALAHQFGFYDQAHFNREFRKFSGLFPTQYLNRRRRDLPQLGKGESVHFAPQ